MILFIGVAFGFIVKTYYGSLPSAIKSSDQLLIAYIIETYDDIPVLRGLFIGAVLSAALSTSSSIIISISDCVHYDFLSFNKFGPMIEKRIGTNCAPRFVSIITGIICYAMALLVAKLGKTIIHMAFANFGICGGPFLGLICAAMQEVRLSFLYPSRPIFYHESWSMNHFQLFLEMDNRFECCISKYSDVSHSNWSRRIWRNLWNRKFSNIPLMVDANWLFDKLDALFYWYDDSKTIHQSHSRKNGAGQN